MLVNADCSSLPDDLASQYPSYQQGQITRQDGRVVSWARVGPENGQPIIYAHGNPGSRFELLFFHDQAVAQHRAIYVVERAGFGCSTFSDEYSLVHYAQDTDFVMDKLKVKRPLDLVGWSSGGPPSFAYSAYFPENVQRVIVASSYTNFGELPDAVAIMKAHHRKGPVLSEKAPRLFHGLVWLVGWTSQHLPNMYYKVTEKEVSDSDRVILEKNGMKALFMLNQEEAFAQGSAGAELDLEVQWRPWPFALSQVKTPVLLMYGREDKLVPMQFMQHLDQRLPHSRLQLEDKEGHLFPLKASYQQKMLEWFTQGTDMALFVTK
ncbi:hypothetical protein GCM10022277_22880 [Litoribacillus peritrichatus]|uniref:AB hydrolase-1 domain-containing protein n=1 Tax=Litoribacillus peritrichatus TaxID=718191 RepID=A0ABP7MMG5_9GAMM